MRLGMKSCTVSVILSCLRRGMFGVTLLKNVMSGGRVWWRLCSGYCNYIISNSDLDNAEVHSPAEQHAAITWAQRLKRVSPTHRQVSHYYQTIYHAPVSQRTEEAKVSTAVFNERRTHSGRDGTTPVSPESGKVVDINDYRWQKHCRVLFHLPIAA